MQTVELNVTSRNVGSRSSLRQLRSQGLVPANIYGPGAKNTFCAFSEKEIRKVFQNDFNSNFIIRLTTDQTDLEGKQVILKSLERDPVSWQLLHADLYEVSMNRPLTVSVPVHYNGTPEGVKVDGGILQVIRRSIKVKALPSDIPDFIDVDISALKINHSIHIRDIQPPAKLEILDSGAFTLVSVVEAEKEEVVAVATPEAAAAGATAPAEGAAATPAAAPAGEKAEVPAKGGK